MSLPTARNKILITRNVFCANRIFYCLRFFTNSRRFPLARHGLETALGDVTRIFSVIDILQGANNMNKVLILRHGTDRVATNVPDSLQATLCFAAQSFPTLQPPFFLTRNVPEAGGDVKITEGVWNTNLIDLATGILILDVHETPRGFETSAGVESDETVSQPQGSVSSGAPAETQERSQHPGIEIEVGLFTVDGKSESHRFRVPLDARIRDVRHRIANIYQVEPEPAKSDNVYRLMHDGTCLGVNDHVRDLLTYGDEEAFVQLDVQVVMVGGMTEEDLQILLATGKMPQYRDKLSQLLKPLPTDPYPPGLEHIA